MSESLRIFGRNYTGVNGIKAKTPEGETILHTAGGGGGTSIERKDVNFFDYDGTIVASYTTAEFANISALPDNPSHDGLIAQGWNIPSTWTLADAKTYVSTNKKADWGQMYTTTSGATEIDVEFTDPNRKSPYMSLAVNGTASIDWGDGSTAESVTGTSLTTRLSVQHNFPAIGKYTIKITAITGSWGFYCTSSYTLLYKNGTSNENRVYTNCVKSVRIGAGCTSIGQYAFNYCYDLASITIPNSVTSISSYALQHCYSLASITIPNSVTSISNGSLYYCYNLTYVAIPNSVTSIGGSAFQYCDSLTTITIPSSVTSIGNSTFGSCYSLQSIVIPDSVTSIGSSAFATCYSLQSMDIPDSVTSIGNSTFQNCYSLASISMPSGVTSIGNTAFGSCFALASVTVSSSVTSIASKAFQNCYGFSSIHFKSSTPPTVEASDAFSNVPTDCIIYVPTGKLSAYTTATNYPSSSTYTYVEE